MSSERKVYGVGILGNSCTHGEFVAAALQAEPQAKIRAGWADDPGREQGLSDAIGMPLAGSADELLADPEIEIIGLACSPHRKAGWVEKAARAGKHVFLNKPMAESLDSARRIEQVIDTNNVQLVYDIPVVVRFNPLTAKLLDEVRAGKYGRPVNYMHSWSMTFSTDFPLVTVWPERLDSPALSGGGEMKNMGSYAIDYMIALWGRPKSVRALGNAYWDIYERANLENFGQIIADYDSFYAVLATGKQPLRTLPTMDVTEALNPRNWHNVLELQFENHNLTAMPFHDILIHNGNPLPVGEFMAGYRCPTPFQQLTQAIETSTAPDSNAGSARLGVEVLMAAYGSIKNGGRPIPLPLASGENPLLEVDNLLV
jgi:predicted dehydrogenase